MKPTFFLLQKIIFCLIVISTITSCKTNVDPTISFNTEYGITSDSIAIIDDENAVLNIALSDLNKYSHYTYTLNNANGKIHTNDTLELSKEFSINLKNTTKLKKYKNQDLDIDVTLIGDGVSKTIVHDIQYQFDANSPIPYVVITTKDGVFPVDRTRIDAEFEFYDTPMKDGWYSMSGAHQSSSGTIHARGQGSLAFPKKSFSLNFGKENPLSIMGMPESHKWVMIGNWVDTSQLCNKVSYDTYADMGHYGPQSKHVQVFLNGQYWGLYTFGEKIQQGKNHVNTAKKSEGGFIVKEVDSEPDFVTITGRRFQYEYPDNEDATPEQKENIQDKINLYEEKVLKGLNWPNYVAESTEIDYFIITDVFANPDSYYNGKNVFYFYNKDDKLEPVIWDYIWSFGTPYYVCDNNNPWCYIYSPIDAGYCHQNTPSCSSWAASRNYAPNSELMYGNPKYGDLLGLNRFLLMKDYMKSAQNVTMFKDQYNDWRTGNDGKKPVLSDKNILSRTQKLIDILRSGEIYKKDSLRWEAEDKFQYGNRYTPEQVRDKIKERLQFMDTIVRTLTVQQ